MTNMEEKLSQLFMETTPDKLNQWLDGVWSGKIEYKKDINSWLFITEGIYHNVLNDPEVHQKIPSKSWAATSISIYEYLNNKSDRVFRSFMQPANYIRIIVIEHFGNIKGDYVCDVDIIYDCFFKTLTMTLKEVKQKTKNWDSKIMELSRDSDAYKLAFENIRELRLIKNNLNVIESLYQLGHKYNKHDLEPWIQIKTELP